MTNHRAEAERLLADADDWAAQAGELSPKASERACLDRAQVHALFAIHDALTAADPAPANPLTETHPWPMAGLTHTRGTQWDAGDRYALNEERQRGGAELDTPSGRAFTAQDKEATDAVRAKINALGGWLPAMEKALAPEPDPLDEDDHRDRVDPHGNTWQRVHEGCWMEPGFPPLIHGLVQCLPLKVLPAPLAFAPKPAPQATGDDLSAPEGESEAEVGEEADDAQNAILCPECNHHIHTHDMDGCLHILCCPRTPEDVARALIDLAVKAEREGK